MRKKRYYALYKGDDILYVGTKEELANYLNVDERTIRFYQTPTYKKRCKKNGLLVIKLEEEKE